MPQEKMMVRGSAMKEQREGIRRLSIFLGGLGSFAWFIFVFIASDAFTNITKTTAWLTVSVGLVVCFLVPCALVKCINWVIIGFSSDKFSNQKNE
jgi:hypothetical protein